MRRKKIRPIELKCYHYPFIFLFPFFFISVKCSLAQPSTEYEKIMNRVRENIWEEVDSIKVLDQKVSAANKTLQKNGSWDDIPYSDTERTNWKPFIHLTRVENFAKAYTMAKSRFYGDPEIQNAIMKALTFWNKKDPQSNNWWPNEIASPKAIGEILIMLRVGKIKLPSLLEHKLIKQMSRGNIEEETGANKLDVAIHYIYRGCLLADKKILQTGVKEAFYPIRFSKKEGLKNDFSYMQHGPQLQISSYGLVFIKGEVKVADFLQGTSYSLKDRKLQLLSKYIRKTYLNVLRGTYVDFSVMGRGISRMNNVDKTSFAATLRKFKAIDDSNEEIYNEAIARLTGHQPPGYKISPMHTYYWQSDFTLHKQADYNFSVRTASTRTIRTENGNEENLKGYFLADGATNILVNGDEYYNIFPVWDWNKIPGVTSTEINPIPKRKSWGTLGTSTFTGGVSDSLYGVTTYALNDYGISVRKGWFFFDDEVVCLGSNINGTSPDRVVTTVNQCLLDGEVTASTNRGISKVGSDKHLRLNNINWVLHDSVGYFFPRGGNINLSNEKQTGNWDSINHPSPDKKIAKKVFKLWFDHGVQPKNKSYTYIVVPGKNSVAAMENYDIDNIQILENDKRIQAVKHQRLDMLQLIFYKPGTFSHENITVKVDRPCVLMLKNISKSNPIMTIADPSQKISAINVSLKLPANSSIKDIKCKMPNGDSSGSTLAVEMK